MATSSRDSANNTLPLIGMNARARGGPYAPNTVRFLCYPEPPWLSPPRVVAFWFIMTPFGIAAYWLYRRGRERAAFATSHVYAAMNLLVLGHYLVTPPWR